MAEIFLEYGIMGVCLLAVGWYVLRITNFLQRELVRKLDTNDERLEKIIIALINQIKLLQLDVKYLKGFINALKEKRDGKK